MGPCPIGLVRLAVDCPHDAKLRVVFARFMDILEVQRDIADTYSSEALVGTLVVDVVSQQLFLRRISSEVLLP